MKFKDYINEVSKSSYAEFKLQDKKTKKYVAKGMLNWRKEESKTKPDIPKLTNNIKDARTFTGLDLQKFKFDWAKKYNTIKQEVDFGFLKKRGPVTT